QARCGRGRGKGRADTGRPRTRQRRRRLQRRAPDHARATCLSADRDAAGRGQAQCRRDLGRVTAITLQTGFARYLWLGAVALILILFGAFLFTRAMQADEDVRVLYRESLAVAQTGFETQLLLDELRRPAGEVRSVLPALRRKIGELSAFHLTGAE